MNRKRHALRDEIVRVAARCFRDQGYRATTLDTIAARAGISKVTLYNYVSGKEDLLSLVFEQAISTYRTGLRQIIAQRRPADDTLRRIIRHQVTTLAGNLSFLTVFFSEESALPPRVAKRVVQEKRACDRAIKAVVRDGIARGRLRDFPPTLVVFALLGMCNWLYKWYRPTGKLAPDQVAGIFVDLLERGYLRRDGEDAGAVLAGLGRIEARLADLGGRLPRRARRARAAPLPAVRARGSCA